MFLYSLNDSHIRLNKMFLWWVNCNLLFPLSFCGKPSGLRHGEGPADRPSPFKQWKQGRAHPFKPVSGIFLETWMGIGTYGFIGNPVWTEQFSWGALPQAVSRKHVLTEQRLELRENLHCSIRIHSHRTDFPPKPAASSCQDKYGSSAFVIEEHCPIGALGGWAPNWYKCLVKRSR